MPCIEVSYNNGQVGHFPLDPQQGWKIDASHRMLIIGHGVPRKMIPLDNVQVIEIVKGREEVNGPLRSVEL